MSRPILPNYEQDAGFPSPEHPCRSPQSPEATPSSSHYPSRPSGAPGAASSRETHPGPAGAPEGTPSSRPTYSKRGKITIVACVPCRKRKTKCDGQRPSCSQCASRRQACFYDMTDDQRKLTHLRENVEHLQEKSESLSSLLHTIQNTSDEEANEVFRRIRSGQNVHVVAEQVQASHLLSGVSGSPGKSDLHNSESHTNSSVYPEGLEARHLDFERLVRVLSESEDDMAMDIVHRLKGQEEISSILRNVFFPALQHRMIREAMQRNTPATLEHNFSRGDQAFGMVKGADVLPSHIRQGLSSEFTIERMHRPWTNVTDDEGLIEHLIEMYFSWQHSFFQSFPEKLFRADMAAGRTKYCSAMLVNVVCACGCFLSERPIVREDRGDGKTLLDSFYDEARELLHRDESSNLTTVATLCLLSYIEGTKGSITSLWLHSGRSALLATDINLHLRRTVSPGLASLNEKERANEHKARTHAFWGSFHSDATSSFTLGRLPNYNIHGITAELPAIDAAEDDEAWSAYELELPHRAGARSSTFLHCAKLSEIMNSSLLMYFAPTASLSGTLLMQQYEKYVQWKRNLPAVLAVTEQCPPHVLSLHMYYHTAVLLLFRPFLKAKMINNPDVVPRDVCRQSATEISSLFTLHLKLFGQVGICMFQIHCLLTSSTIHIVNLPTISATREFTAACDHFHALVHRNEWARSSIHILRGLVDKWQLILPQEAEAALYRPLPGDEDVDPSGTSSGSLGISATPLRFTLPTDPASAYETHQQPGGPSLSTRMKQAALQDNPPNVDPALSQGQPPPKRQRVMASQTQGNTPQTAGPAQWSALEQGRKGQPNPAHYLYAPLANQPAPFLVPVRSQRRAGVSAGQQQDVARQRRWRQYTETNGPGQANAPGSAATEEGEGESRDSPDRLEVKPEDTCDGIEGLSFGDDWRDPFLGFLSVEDL